MQVYKITCSVNGKSYIGITKRGVDVRFRQHIRDAKKCVTGMLLHKAINKHGPENFTVEVVAQCSSMASLLEAERALISEHNTLSPNGYNLCGGGEGVFNPSDETRKKKSESALALHSDCGFSDRHANGIRSFYASLTDEQMEERRAKIKESREANGHIGFPKAALDAAAAAKKTPEWSEKASSISAAKWQEPGYTEKWSASVRRQSAAKKDRFVSCIDNGLIFSSARAGADWARANGFPKAARNNLCLCCNGKYKSFCGMQWEYIDADQARVSGVEILI